MKKQLRLVIDIAMVTLLLFAYNSQLARGTVHIYIGIAIFVLFVIHIFINRQWFSAMFKGPYTPRRTLLTVVNSVLILTAATLILSGIAEARWKPSFSGFESGITIREIHTIAAYWLLPIAGIHLGLHGGMFSKYIREKRSAIIIMRILAVLFVCFGVWSFLDRDMFSKMFLGYSFDYWPPERPIILFYAQTLSIMGIFVFSAYYFLKFIAMLKKKQQAEVL